MNSRLQIKEKRREIIKKIYRIHDLKILNAINNGSRVQEHSRKKGLSHIIEHRKVCKADTNISDFKILHKNFGSYWERILCEALVIKDQSPSINIQSSTNLLRVFI